MAALSKDEWSELLALLDKLEWRVRSLEHKVLSYSEQQGMHVISGESDDMFLKLDAKQDRQNGGNK